MADLTRLLGMFARWQERQARLQGDVARAG
jgi:hypothetical protein